MIQLLFTTCFQNSLNRDKFLNPSDDSKVAPIDLLLKEAQVTVTRQHGSTSWLLPSLRRAPRGGWFHLTVVTVQGDSRVFDFRFSDVQRFLKEFPRKGSKRPSFGEAGTKKITFRHNEQELDGRKNAFQNGFQNWISRVSTFKGTHTRNAYLDYFATWLLSLKHDGVVADQQYEEDDPPPKLRPNPSSVQDDKTTGYKKINLYDANFDGAFACDWSVIITHHPSVLVWCSQVDNFHRHPQPIYVYILKYFKPWNQKFKF